MKVCFSVGKNSKKIVNSLVKFNDGVEFFIYDSVSHMINESSLRHIYFDRIIFHENVLDDKRKDLEELNNYIVDNSESSTVVLLINSIGDEADAAFQEIFRSPLYTAVMLGSATINKLSDVITKDIVSVKAKYYIVDGEVPKKKGLFGKGTFDKKENTENQPKNLDSKNSGRNTDNSDRNDAGTGSREIVDNGTRNGQSSYGLDSGEYNQSQKSEGFSASSEEFLDSHENIREKNDFESEDDFLGIGSYGASHSDTGFLDENDIPVNTSEKKDNQKVDRQGSIRDSEKQKTNERDLENDTGFGIDPSQFTKVILVTGERGVGVTTSVVNMAIDLYEKGESVLIVDGDYKRNGILSFIDARDFYDKGNEDGIETQNPYVDEEADIVSNGYGASISKSSMTALIGSKTIQNTYDRIIVDCPLDCLNCISERSVRGRTVVVLSKGDRVSLTSTSIGLTDRSVVEAGLERYIMENCVIALSNHSEEFEEDIRFVEDTVMFPNGCWLQNIG